MEPPAPVISPPASTSFPAVGCDVRLFFVYREGRVWEAERQEGQELTVIKFDPAGPVSAGKRYVLETTGGLKIEGIVDLDDETGQATIAVVHDTVRSCLCCTDMGLPNPPFSSSPNGMTVRFSESDPHTIEATILAVEKRPTRSVVHLQMTSLPPYSACLGDRIMLSSGLSTWEATVMYFDDPDRRMDELSGTILDNRISIYVLDEHVPQGPIYLPHTKILVRPAPSGPANVTINHRGKGVSQRKRRSSAHEENEANKKKIKVAINGYRDIGRALARVALDSDDVDLVAINDPSIIDQVSCMFRDSKCDFEVKRGNSDILLFGEKEVKFFRESDHSAVPWYMARTKLVVTSRNSSQEEVSYKKYASEYGQPSDVRLSGPLGKMLGTSTIPNCSWASILKINPINSSDAKSVGDCFPLWKGKRLVSVVHFQGVDIIFELQEYPQYDWLPNSTLPSLDFACVVRWCFNMLSRLPPSFCHVEMSQPSRYFGTLA